MDRHRLGRLVRQRRQELGLSIRAAARAADGMDRSTWTALEEGTRATRDHNYASIERALSWPVGTVESIISGEHPDARDGDEPELLDDNERAIWAMDALSKELRLEYIRIYRAWDPN